MFGCSCTLFNKKETFNTKYPQLLVAKDFAVAEKKLHLAVSGRKYNPGKKAPKKRHTSDVKTADPKPSTSQDKPQDESISEQQPQGVSTSEQQPQGKASTDTQQEPVPSKFSDDDELPDPYALARKTFATKDARSIPKKPKYSSRLSFKYTNTEFLHNKKQIQVSTGKYKVGTHLSFVAVLVLFTSSSLISTIDS